MGAVHLAHDRKLGRRVALKVLLADHRCDEARERFIREARALAQLTHPNVVQVFEVGEIDGAPFMAMELIEGPNLRRWLQQPRETAEILAVFAQAARGLQAAHRAGIVHRDFKPDNVVVGDDGRVRVVDFGLAASPAPTEPGAFRSPVPTPASDRLTATGTVMGTPAYMAPEQHMGAAASATASADQFAFCVALWEALHGVRPFAGTRAETVLSRIVRGELTRPRTRRRLPGTLRRALRRGLRPFPNERWPDMAPLVEALAPPRRRRMAWVLPLGAAVAAGVAFIPDGATSDSRVQ